jgi:hypothetical protein
MSDYFIGAYLEIECNKMTIEREYWTCLNWHGKTAGYYKQDNKFCPTCGQPVTLRTTIEQEYPRWIVDDILPDNWENKLQEITPRKMFGTGRILATWNGDPDVGVYAWLHPNNDRDPGVVEIPTADDMARIMAEFAEGYKDVITALGASPLVRSIEVKFGIVKQEEY